METVFSWPLKQGQDPWSLSRELAQEFPPATTSCVNLVWPENIDLT